MAGTAWNQPLAVAKAAQPHAQTQTPRELRIEDVGGSFFIFLSRLRYMSYGNIHSYNELITNTMNNNMLNLFCYFLKILF